ncbi:hypothetical protein [Fluviicola sp.]|uniref:hypothetical protein n=1 Tax=Fluviicola sp. TaxID=1917219 RepID=UPI0031D99DCD
MKLVLFVSFLPFFINAQNLVINPGFEKVESIPLLYGSSGNLPNDMNWWAANNATIDLYSLRTMNSLVKDSFLMTPFHGDNYLGAIVSEKSVINYGEILQGELTQKLQKNKSYLIGAYLRFGVLSMYKSSDYSFGVSKKKQYEKLFFKRYLIRKTLKNISRDSIPDVWKFNSSIYKAHGNEKYVVFGNLRQRINIPNTIQANPAVLNLKSGLINHAYVDIDDIFVIEIPENYDSIKKETFHFSFNQKLSLLPSVGDSVFTYSQGFYKEQWKLTDSMSNTLNELVNYLKLNPFITVELSIPLNAESKMSQLDRLKNKRLQSLELYFEKKGVSFNRIHLSWNETTERSCVVVKIHDVLLH